MPDGCPGSPVRVDEVEVPQCAFDIGEHLAVEFLASEAGAFVPVDDLLGECGCEVVEVGVGGCDGVVGAGILQEGLQPGPGLRGGSEQDAGACADAQTEQQVVPALLDERPVGGFVEPGVAVFGAAEAVGFFTGEGGGDASVGPGESPLGGFVLGASVGSGDGDDAGFAFQHGVSHVCAGRADDGDTPGGFGHLVGVFGTGSGLSGTAAAGDGPGEPVGV